jgi:hypothetical protein
LPSYTATDRELERRTDQHVDLQHLGHHQSGRRRSLRRGRHNRAGEFQGAQASLTVVDVTPNPLACLTPGGVTHGGGPAVFEVL